MSKFIKVDEKDVAEALEDWNRMDSSTPEHEFITNRLNSILKGAHSEADQEEKMNVLQEAQKLTSSMGDRREDYGPPEEEFSRLGGLWEAYLGHKVTISKTDVAMMLLLLKVARNAHKYKRDNMVDICGYARCAEMCDEAK